MLKSRGPSGKKIGNLLMKMNHISRRHMDSKKINIAKHDEVVESNNLIKTPEYDTVQRMLLFLSAVNMSKRWVS